MIDLLLVLALPVALVLLYLVLCRLVLGDSAARDRAQSLVYDREAGRWVPASRKEPHLD